MVDENEVLDALVGEEAEPLGDRDLDFVREKRIPAEFRPFRSGPVYVFTG